MGELDGKVAIVTGAGRGLGRAGALALARAGARISVSDLDGDAAARVAREIREAAGEASSCTCDAGDSASVQAMVQHTLDAFGHIDVLYNNAGIAPVGEDGATDAMSEAAWDRVLRVNLTSVFLCSKYAIPHLARTKGAIVNTASSMALLPLGAVDAYAASKAGVAGLTRSMAASCGAKGIRVNAICPGYVDTDMNAMIFGVSDLRDAFAIGHATGLQTPEEIADLVVFLASERARSITGAVLACDRGWTAFKAPELVSRMLIHAAAPTPEAE